MDDKVFGKYFQMTAPNLHDNSSSNSATYRRLCHYDALTRLNNNNFDPPPLIDDLSPSATLSPSANKSYAHRDSFYYFSMPTGPNILLFTSILFGLTSMSGLSMLVSKNFIIYILELIMKLPLSQHLRCSEMNA